MSETEWTLSRRDVIASIGVTSAVGLTGCTGGSSGDGQSSDYPAESITLTVPYASGGGFDAYARITKPYWEDHFPNTPTITVENVSGGGGVTGATQVYTAQPDGYQFMIWDAVQAVTQQIGREVGYKIEEMSYIGALTQSPNCLITMNSAGIDGWESLVNNISDINFATQGNGAISHIGIVLLGELTGAWTKDDVNFVHFGGTGDALAGLERGEAEVFLPGTATSGLKVVDSLKAEMTILFSDPVGEDSIFHGVPKQFSSELDVENMDRYAELTVFRRFFTGPPEVPDDILQIQRDVFSGMIKDKDLLTEAEESGRPIVNPGPPKEVSDNLNAQFETFGNDTLKDLLREIFES